MKYVQGKGRQICWNVVELRELFCHQHDGDSFELIYCGCFLFFDGWLYSNHFEEGGCGDIGSWGRLVCVNVC